LWQAGIIFAEQLSKRKRKKGGDVRMIVFLKTMLDDIIEERKQLCSRKECHPPEKGMERHSGENRTTTFMLIDEHSVTRIGLSYILEKNESFSVVSGETDPMKAIGKINRIEPDFIITELAFRQMDGLSFVKVIRKAFPFLPVLVLTVYDELFFAGRALRAGANGYVMKHESTEKIEEAITAILKGNIYFSDKVKNVVIEDMSGAEEYSKRQTVNHLNDLELATFMLIGKGYRPQQIAKKLRLTINTIEGFRASIKNKLMFHSSSELRQYAVEWIRQNRDSLIC
jgi:DNA-binding NarL/FixJ family response regulator